LVSVHFGVVAFGNSQGERRPDNCSCAVRSNFQSSSQLPEPLTHATKSHSGSAGGTKFYLLIYRNALAVILNFNKDPVVFLNHANDGGIATGMAVDIREALLDHPKNRNLHLLGQAPELGRNFQINFDLASF